MVRSCRYQLLSPVADRYWKVNSADFQLDGSIPVPRLLVSSRFEDSSDFGS